MEKRMDRDRLDHLNSRLKLRNHSDPALSASASLASFRHILAMSASLVRVLA